MVLRTDGGAPTGEDVDDLAEFLRSLGGAPPVHEVVPLWCAAHDDEPVSWAYVEADPVAGTARRRCLACGAAVAVLDSGDRWTHPPMHSCSGCGQSIVEIAVALSVPDGAHVTWLAVGVRCVACSRLAGVTDLVVDGMPLTEVRAGL